jgi:hypothetical protein
MTTTTRHSGGVYPKRDSQCELMVEFVFWNATTRPSRGEIRADILALTTRGNAEMPDWLGERMGFELVVAFRRTIAVYWPAKGVFRLSAGNRECQTGESGRLHGAGSSVRNQRLVLFLPTHFPVMPAKKPLPVQESRFCGRYRDTFNWPPRAVGLLFPSGVSSFRGPTGAESCGPVAGPRFRHCLVATEAAFVTYHAQQRCNLRMAFNLTASPFHIFHHTGSTLLVGLGQ